MEEAANGAAGLIAALRRVFVTYGISDELTSDGGPEFTSINPFASIGRTGTSNGKVKVMVICLNISFKT